MFVEAFHSMIKGIHLFLEVKTSFDNSTLAMNSSIESSTYKPGLPTNNHHWHHQKEEKENMHTKTCKAKLERLRSWGLTRHDQEVTLLDMQMLQVAKDI
jgi:hypothetical protein